MIDHETSLFLGAVIMVLAGIVLVGLAALINEWGKGRARRQEKAALRLAKVRERWTRPRMFGA